MAFIKGLSYDGNWKNDKAHGHGTAQYENGSVYIGDFMEDVRSGWGSQFWPSGDAYEGEWDHDVIHGKGRWKFPDASYFEGEWRDGNRYKGTFVSSDGRSEYNGAWENNVRHGYGTFCHQNAYKYAGLWDNDFEHGQGQATYPDGSVYDGEFQRGKRHARGKWRGGGSSSDGQKYDGEWKDDCQHGVGMSMTSSGDKYKGEFKDGVRHGRGQCMYADGMMYDGEWTGDMRNGEGVCAFPNGDTYKGQWKNDKRHGQGICKFSDGTKFRGEWEEDCWVQSTAEPSKCKVVGPGVTRATAGMPSKFIIQARDENGNKRLTGGDEFRVVLVHDNTSTLTTATVKDECDGTHSVEYVLTVAGVYELHITLPGDEDVADSPYPVRVVAGRPSVKHSSVVGAGRKSAVAGVETHFEIIVRDSHGNETIASYLPVEVELEGGNGISTPITVETDGRSKYVCTYRVSQPGYHRLYVTSNGCPLPHTPYSLYVCDEATAQEKSVAIHSANIEELEGDSAPRKAATTPTPIKDHARIWEKIAESEYAAIDGDMTGWDDEFKRSSPTTAEPEDDYSVKHPDIPVVENLEDIWLVSKLQKERKQKEEMEKLKKLTEFKETLERKYGEAERVTVEKMTAEVKDIIKADVERTHTRTTLPKRVVKKEENPRTQIDFKAQIAQLNELE